MLYQLGPVAFVGNTGASADQVTLKSEADLAKKGLIGGLPGYEWTGYDASMTLSGKVLPYHLGGLDAVASLHAYVANGTQIPVMRGDGAFLGWYGVKSVEEKHDQLSPSGIGYEVAFTVSLVRMDRPDAASIDSMTSLVVNLINQLTLSVTGPIVSAITNIFG